MHNYAPKDYICPLCLTSQGIENENTMAKQADIIYRDDLVFAMINSKFVGNNSGHVIIVPIDHYENIFDLPTIVGQRIFDVAKSISIAMKEIRKCDGIMTQQNNGPASGQHAFHFHFHIFPRFTDDKFHDNPKVWVAEAEERKEYADGFKKYFEKNPVNI